MWVRVPSGSYRSRFVSPPYVARGALPAFPSGCGLRLKPDYYRTIGAENTFNGAALCWDRREGGTERSQRLGAVMAAPCHGGTRPSRPVPEPFPSLPSPQDPCFMLRNPVRLTAKMRVIQQTLHLAKSFPRSSKDPSIK